MTAQDNGDMFLLLQHYYLCKVVEVLSLCTGKASPPPKRGDPCTSLSQVIKFVSSDFFPQQAAAYLLCRR